MIRGLVFGLVLLTGTSVFAQQKNTAGDSLPPIEVQRQMFIYSIAKKYNDPVMQQSALYNILSWNPTNLAILDSLAIMYLDFQQYASAALISQDILKLNPKDVMAIEIAAISFETLGVKDRALPYYEKLYLLNQDVGILYQVAFMQFDLKRYNEAINNADNILKVPEAEKRMMLFPLAQKNQTQQVSMVAATYRLKAMIEEERGNIDQARELYQKTLEIAPDFYMVKTQLESLK